MSLPLEPEPKGKEKENKSSSFPIPHFDSKILVLRMRPTEQQQIPFDVGKPLDFNAKVGGIDTSVCADTGAGASVLSTELMEKENFQILDTKQLERPIEMVVGDSDTMTIDHAVLASLEAKGQEGLNWWLVHDKLPVPALIGRTTCARLDISHDTKTDKVSWNGTILDSAQQNQSLLYTTPLTEDIEEQPPQPVYTVKTTKIPPRSMKKVLVRVNNPTSPEGYFVPELPTKGKLTGPQGPAFFESQEKGSTTILIINPTTKHAKLKANTMVGNVQFINDKDVERTELIEMSSHSLTAIQEIIDKRLEEKRKQKEKEQKPRTINVKVGLNYHKALPPGLFEVEEQTTSPIDFSNLITHNQSPHKDSFLQGYLHGIEVPPDEWTIDHVISLFRTNPILKEEVDKIKDIPEELQHAFETFRLEDSAITMEQKIQLARLLLRYVDIWNEEKREGPIEHTTTVECGIETDPKKGPIRSRPMCTNLTEDYIIWKHIKKMAKRKVIRPSKSPWASPIILADKKCGKIRFCVDFRKLNSVTKQDAYPLPRMDEIIKSLGGASYFSLVDQTEAFWSIKIKDEDIPKTAFTSKHGLWEFISMPFGLTNAPATQQRFLEEILNGLLWKCCFAYVDDILCFSNTFKQHLIDLESIFQRFRKHKLQIQPKKCDLCKPSFEILGYVATKEGLKPNPKKIKAIKEYPCPKSPKEIESFLGMIAWQRKFIPNCSSLTRNLRACYKKTGSDFQMTEKAIQEVEILKTVLTSETCLAHPKLDEQFYIHVDASKLGLGAILTQTDEKGKHRVIEYASKSLTQAQQKYSNPSREAYGILWALNEFHYYIYRKTPIVFCDCQCLSDIMKPGGGVVSGRYSHHTRERTIQGGNEVNSKYLF